MGNYNVDAAYTLFGGLKHRAHRALTYMARRALDPPGADGRPPLLYFGGHTELAAAIGLVPFGTPSLEVAHKEIVRRVVNELKDAGAVELVSGGHRASAAVYRLQLIPAALNAGKVRRNGGLEGPPNQRTISTISADQQSAVSADPRGEGGLQTKEEEDNLPDPAISPAAVDNSGDEQVDTETANRRLVHHHGLEHAMRLLDEHAAAHPDCDSPSAHLLQAPTLTVIPGGKTA